MSLLSMMPNYLDNEMPFVIRTYYC